ncbi:TonB-dependent receptor [Roseateles asaccharophilus]|uniref:Iron complex outermembrane receptor protein n=1 Tax=Roseateles asaccharophilus TaxID=582607 RepID=A0ABU2ADU0_9BURK|nr:TonB-dependent receptor [Roseateles asaccharophilus]MDR7335374.1 iron complex outermembrane receptor protein [Roseateles asaccharophilus]
MKFHRPLLALALLLGALNSPAQTPQAPQPAASVPAAAAAAASAPAKPAEATPPNALDRVQITAAAETDDGLRRRQSIAMSIYGREELDRQGDIDVTDVLKRLPGVSMDGGAPRLRGLGGGYTQILINGEPAPPGFSLDTLAPGDVERIEVVAGATAEYPGVAGTINVVLREPPRTLQREWRSNLNYRALQPGGSTAFQWGDRIGALSFVVPMNVTRSAWATAYEQVRLSRTPAGEVQSQAIDGRDQGRSSSAQIAPRLQWKFTDWDTLNLSAFWQHTQGRNASDRRIVALLGTPWQTARDESQSENAGNVLRAAANWIHKQEDGGKIELRGTWQDTTRDSSLHYDSYRADGRLLVTRETQTDFGEERVALGGRWTQPVAEDHTIVTGWDMETRERDELRRVWDAGIERIDSATGVPFAARIGRVAVFIQDDWALSPQWGLQPGLRLEQVRTRGDNGTNAIDNQNRVVAPTLHINYKFDPKGRDQIRASVTRSFKLPDLSALVSRYVLNGNYERTETNTPIAADSAGNPQLQPELSTGFDLRFEHYPASGGVLSIGMFYRQIDDLIRRGIRLETGMAPDITNMPRWVSRPMNIGQATTRGLEFEIKGRGEEWLPALFDKDSGVNLRAAFNLYRSQVEQVDGPDNRLEAQPPWLSNMGFDWRIRDSGWTVGASLILQPGYATNQTDRQVAQRSAQRTLDAFAAWKVDRFSQLRVGLTNLLAPDSVVASAVEDVDGFSAGSSTRRNTLRAINASWVVRF